MYSDMIEKLREQSRKQKEQEKEEHKPEEVRIISRPKVATSKRRSMKRTAPVSRDYIRLLLNKFDTIEYGQSIRTGMPPEKQRERNKVLLSILYLSARRISEIVGRKYKGFTCKGVFIKDFREDKLEGNEVLIMNCRILKKWKKKTDEPNIVRGDIIMDMQDTPFIDHITSWLEYKKKIGEEKFLSISQCRAWTIFKQLDSRIVGSHWFRHMRLSHLAETLNPYELNEQIGFWESLDPAIAYVHGRVSDYLDACEKARIC